MVSPPGDLIGLPTANRLVGLSLDVDDVRAHGRDERMSVESFERALEFTYRLIKGVANPVMP